MFKDGSLAPPASSGTAKRKKPGITDNLATHVPDFVLATSNIEVLPYSQKFEGVLLFADISGRATPILLYIFVSHEMLNLVNLVRNNIHLILRCG